MDKDHYVYECWANLPEGRVVGAANLPDQNRVLLYFSKRLTPEAMGEYRLISELNEKENLNFRLSKNRRSLISTLPISGESASALRDVLNDKHLLLRSDIWAYELKFLGVK